MITQCSICGKDIKYTTRKPKKCVECKKPKSETKKKRHSRFPRNKGTNAEKMMFYLIDQLIIGCPFINHGYYSFLLSPKYSPMQLDRYYYDLKLAFEYDGEQHDKYVKFIHKSKINFEYYQTCDKLKTQQCKDNGITLIRINHKDKLNEQLIVDKIKEANPLLYERLLKERRLRIEDYT